MSTSNRDQVEKTLLEMYQANRPFLTEYPWEWEQDRWAELVTCLLITEAQLEPDRARRGVEMFKELGLVTPDRLADADDHDQLLLQSLIVRLGAQKPVAEQATTLLVKIAATVIKSWNGHIQRFLRDYGRRIAEDLAAVFVQEGMNVRNASKAAILWLQNVANMPLLLTEDTHVQDFCKREKVREDELLEIADHLDLNVAVIDDLLALENQEQAERALADSQDEQIEVTK